MEIQLCTIRTNRGLRLTAQTEHGVVDLADASKGRTPSTMKAFLEAGPDAWAVAREVLADSATAGMARALDREAFAPVVPDPRKIICVGLNYRDHALEVGKEPPAYPTLFTRFATSLAGPYDDIAKPTLTTKWDYEAELAIVIGKRARMLEETEALDCVAGYTVANDLSARDFQNHTSQWTPGKNFDASCPLGPVLVTSDELEDPHALPIVLTVNGEVLQQSSTAELIFTIPQLLVYITSFMTLEPGDVILTGTPAGVGFVRKPPRLLGPGDKVAVTIGGIGRIENTIVAEEK